jgi:DNA recombination protein RmuC
MQTQQLLLLVTGFLIGLLTTSFVAWLIVRRTKALLESEIKGQSQIEIARLTERTSSLSAELTQSRTAMEKSSNELRECHSQLEVVREERSMLTERASRLPDVEAALASSLTECDEVKMQIANLREKLGGAVSTSDNFREQATHLQTEVSKTREIADMLLAEQENLKMQLAEITTTLSAERKQTSEKIAFLDEAREQLAERFKSVANDVLEDKTQRFTEQNKLNIGQILEPLRVKLQEFQGKVEEVYVQEGKDRSALVEQVKNLMSLNQQLSEDAHNLTKALTGSSKAQGNWGELILERILESAGLREGQEYDLRASVTREDGTRAQPDVVIHLPEGRELVVDAKVSLTAYDENVKGETDSVREAALSRHISSVRTHIRELSQKNYQSLYGLKSLDFVIMFVPIESAFMLAIASDTGLCEEAWRKNVLLVSPSTLLFVVRTVAHLWRQEQQTRSVQEIAKRGAELYDKLVGFVEDFSKLGERLAQARDSYDGALAKLSTGRGNVIRQAEMLRELGVKPTKSLPLELIEVEQDEPHTSLPAIDSTDSGTFT